MARSPLTVDLDPALRRRVEIAARNRDTTIDEWIEEAVRRELAREEPGGDAFSRVSAPAFARDWDSEADAVYDELAP